MLVGAREEALEEQPQQLERDILEGERRAVEQFEQPLALVQLDERGDSAVGKAAIGLGAERADLVTVERTLDEGRHHRDSRIDIGEAA